jgi:hypothetical protein
MHTARTIVLILVTVLLAVLSAVAVATALLGAAGFLAAVAVLTAAALGYRWVLGPWHRHWGATRAEADAPLPGDELVHEANGTTRSIDIAAPPDAVWPWLVQIGFGRAGWYSYDWIDNDGRPSASTIVPDLQDLAVGDRIPMTPDAGFVVRALDPPHHLVAVSDDGTTSWCLELEPRPGGGTHLRSRFRAHFDRTPTSSLWAAVADPGTFLMERRMLKGIRERATTHPEDGDGAAAA